MNPKTYEKVDDTTIKIIETTETKIDISNIRLQIQSMAAIRDASQAKIDSLQSILDEAEKVGVKITQIPTEEPIPEASIASQAESKI